MLLVASLLRLLSFFLLHFFIIFPSQKPRVHIECVFLYAFVPISLALLFFFSCAVVVGLTLTIHRRRDSSGTQESVHTRTIIKLNYCARSSIARDASHSIQPMPMLDKAREDENLFLVCLRILVVTWYGRDIYVVRLRKKFLNLCATFFLWWLLSKRIHQSMCYS